jgi:hypothetical protein
MIIGLLRAFEFMDILRILLFQAAKRKNKDFGFSQIAIRMDDTSCLLVCVCVCVVFVLELYVLCVLYASVSVNLCMCVCLSICLASINMSVSVYSL